MTTRERFLATGVLSLILLAGGGFLFNLFFLEPLAARRRASDAMRAEIVRKEERIQQVRAEKPKLDRWRMQSLPGDTDTEQYSSTRRLYNSYLRELLTENELAATTMKIQAQKPDSRSSPLLPGKKPMYTKLPFTVETARGNLGNLVNLLDDFYHAGMLHQVKKLSVSRPRTQTGQQADDLDINMTVEALVLNGTEPRSNLTYVDRRLVALDTAANLRGGPFGLGLSLMTAGPAGRLGPAPLAVPARHYADISLKNVFFPAEQDQRENEIDLTRFVFLTDITQNDRRAEAWLYDRSSNKSTRLRSSAGFNSFRVTDDKDETLVRGTVVRLTDREVYFKSDDSKYYAIHVGQSLEEALRTPLPESKVKEVTTTTAGR
jgi:hypothetical protein